MTTPITKAEATEAQRAGYLEASLETELGLREAVRLLKVRQALSSDPDETRRIQVELLDLEADAAKVHAEMLAFSAERRRFRPPSEAELTEIKGMARALDELVAEKTETAEVVRLATQLLDKWSRTRG